MSKSIVKMYLLMLAIALISSQEDVIFSRDSGFYDSEFLLRLSTSSEALKIFYTTDGSDPTNSTTSTEYIGPIRIIDRSQEPNIYGNYEEDMDSPYSISYNKNYKKPPFLLEKAMIVRAVSKKGESFGNTISKTYFITDKDLSLFKKYSVISLVTNPDNLFGADNGIYVLGNLFMEYKKSGKYDPSKPFDSHKECGYCEKGSEWEREASLTIFHNGEISLEQNVGIRIKGQSTRDAPQKSFRVEARKKYGKKKMKTSTLFPNNKDINGNPITEYDSLCIRAASDDDRERDLLVNEILYGRRPEGVIEMKESFLFLNGEFWGMYVITEKYSEEYFASHYNLPSKNILYTTGSVDKEDTPQEIKDFFDFMNTYSSKDLSIEENYKEVCKVLDVDSAIKHYATGIYFAVQDWPNNNYGLWKYNGEKIEGNEYSDGRWRFINFDYDFTMGKTMGGGPPGPMKGSMKDSTKGPMKGFMRGSMNSDAKSWEYDMFTHVENSGQRAPTNIYVALLKNEEFKNKFIEYYENYVNTIPTLDIVYPIIQQFDEEISFLVGYSISRWKGYLYSSKEESISESILNYRSKTLPSIKEFLENRPRCTLENMRKYFKIE